MIMASKGHLPRHNYARAHELKRAIEAARANGIDVATVDLLPDGTIRLSRPFAAPPAANEFDRWNAAGKL
jgi:hypothetical protein